MELLHPAQPVKVYNFEVEDFHTYFVSEAEVLVHNASCGAGGGEIKHVYDSVKKAPKYPEGFRLAQNGRKKVTVNEAKLLSNLRQVEPGKWWKVFEDGYDAYGNKISIHYFVSKSGKVFDVDVKRGWSHL